MPGRGGLPASRPGAHLGVPEALLALHHGGRGQASRRGREDSPGEGQGERRSADERGLRDLLARNAPPHGHLQTRGRALSSSQPRVQDPPGVCRGKLPEPGPGECQSDVFGPEANDRELRTSGDHEELCRLAAKPRQELRRSQDSLSGPLKIRPHHLCGASAGQHSPPGAAPCFVPLPDARQSRNRHVIRINDHAAATAGAAPCAGSLVSGAPENAGAAGPAREHQGRAKHLATLPPVSVAVARRGANWTPQTTAAAEPSGRCSRRSPHPAHARVCVRRCDVACPHGLLGGDARCVS
mmetsp:Transcript_118044/g.280224  ORF Transcript_118044/g.280224 Transcript_118044/m.280224 type:complete len:297 (+) Transcript_118044:1520-2410(+)